MNKIFKIFCLLTFIIFVGKNFSAEIELKKGSNEILIKLSNKSNLNFHSVHIEIKPENLPLQILWLNNTPSVDLLAKDEIILRLNIEVKDNAQPGIYQIPLIIKDQANHFWHHLLTAKLVTCKPDKYDLSQNYPNPFNSQTEINYSLKNDKPQSTKLIIFDLLGRQIRTLVNKNQIAGIYNISWDGRDENGNDVPSGVYFYKLTSGSYSKVRKMSVIR